MCVLKHIWAHMSICTLKLSGIHLTWFSHWIFYATLKSQLCLESPQVPKLFTWFPLSPISCCQKPWMVTLAIGTFCIKKKSSFLFPPCSFPSLSFSCLQAALNNDQEAAACLLHPLCAGWGPGLENLSSVGSALQRRLIFRFWYRLSTSADYVCCVPFQREGLGQAVESMVLLLSWNTFHSFLRARHKLPCETVWFPLWAVQAEEAQWKGLGGFYSRIHLRICPPSHGHPRNEKFKRL